jgi:hypothetical protein
MLCVCWSGVLWKVYVRASHSQTLYVILKVHVVQLVLRDLVNNKVMN